MLLASILFAQITCEHRSYRRDREGDDNSRSGGFLRNRSSKNVYTDAKSRADSQCRQIESRKTSRESALTWRTEFLLPRERFDHSVESNGSHRVYHLQVNQYK